MIKAYKYKLRPNKAQMELLLQFFGCARFIYNWGLNIKTSEYKENGKSVTYGMLAKKLTLLKQQEAYKWLQDAPNECLQQSLRNLESAYTRFFREKKGYPRFKSRKDRTQSVKMINSTHFDFDAWKVKLPKLGWVKMCMNKPFDNKWKHGTVTVSLDTCGTVWCSVVVDNGQAKPSKAKMVEATAVGIDLGIKDFAILSDGTKVSNPKYYEHSYHRLARLQRKFARTKKGSNRHEYLRTKVARCHRHIANQRNDMLHKLSSYLVQNYDTICLEDLNVNGMMKNGHLARAIQDASWSTFKTMLQYKSEWFGKNILFIGRFDPSSKLCSKCGYINKELKLSDREWTCPICGERHDRDINAAMNIRHIAFEKQNLIGI